MKTVGIHRTYPDTTGDRRAEGGMRVQGVSRPDDGAPLVTILTVCFNSAATIAQTIGLADANISILTMIRVAPDFSEMEFDLEVWDLRQFSHLLAQLSDLDCVSTVKRVFD